jgi:type VI secretion system protein ImpL
VASILLSVVVLIISLLLAWAAGPVLHVEGTALIVLRVLLILLGISAAGVILWLYFRSKRRSSGAPAGAGDTLPLDTLLKDAAGKLASAQRSGPKTLDSLPLIYVLGDANSAKTTTILKSGLDPELLAGQVYRDQDILPTPVVNLWYTRQAVIVEAGEALRQDVRLWSRLVRRTRPKAYRAAFGPGAPVRAAIVCVSCERFLGTTATEVSIASARATGEQLRDLSRQLGTELPVYVVLTKLDRVPNFAEFVRTLSSEEAMQVLGITLPRSEASAGLYAEQATREISAALDGIVFSLAEFRLDLLARETDAAKLAGVYEFPRELRKFRNNLTAYLVELVRPSHLSVNPYLRGFYFIGIRAQIVEQLVTAPAAAPQAAPADASATRMFSLQEMQRAAAPQSPAVVAQKVAQWTFLPRIIPQVVLGDKTALAGTSKTGRASLFLRILWGTAATLIAIYLILLIISFGNNSSLERQITSAAQALPPISVSPAVLASTQQLSPLDQLRSSILQLESYQRDGAPTMYRWGLYHGDSLLPAARQVYFDRFRRLLLDNTQTNLTTALAALPPTPSPGADYNAAYSALRAYLITTSNADKSTIDFLPPVLMENWKGAHSIDTDQQKDLARQQFDFYAEELRKGNPYSIAPAMAAVGHARTYLGSFGGFERIYQSMLQAAGKVAPSIDFNRQFPHSAETVVESHSVAGAFTKPGFTFIQDAILHPDRYFSGEAWVLGDQAPPSLDRASLTQQLASRYRTDFLTEWRSFLRNATVVRYRNLQDAGGKLTVLSGTNSPLLALIYTVSHNTAVPDPQISDAFQSTQALVPPDSVDRYIAAGNTSYVNALLSLQGSIAQVAQNPAGANDPTAAMPITSAAGTAHIAAQQTAQSFRIDPQAHMDSTVLALMEAPITSAEALVRGLGPAQANAGGKSFCAAYNGLFSKFPFSPNSTIQASPAEVTALLQPGTGALWQFYNANLKTILIQQGAEYLPAPNPPVHVTPGFVRFFNRAAALSAEFFPAGATGPSLVFAMKNIPSNGIKDMTFAVDSQKMTGADGSKQFTWAAQTAQQAQLSANGLPLQFQGTWSLFELLNKARVAHAGSNQLEFPLEVANTPVKAPDGTPLVVRFELSGPGAEVLLPGALSGVRCVSEVAH